MKGLIIKDLLNLRKYFKMLILFLILYSFISLNSGSIVLLMLMVSLLMTMMVTTSITEDESVKWDRFALAMPISRKTLVNSKYLLLALLLIVGIIPATGLSYIIMSIKGNLNLSGILLTSYGAFALAIFFISVSVPFIHKYGVEKTRFLTIAFVAIPVAISWIIETVDIALPSKEQLSILLKLSPVLLALLMLASIKISYSIYRTKDI